MSGVTEVKGSISNSEHMRERSGDVSTTSPLVAALYLLLRDHVPPGEMENVMLQVQDVGLDYGYKFSNGWLAEYAMDVAKRLR